jgi:hypothetical protein
MLRRVVAFLLIPSILPAQFVGMGHSHGGNSASLQHTPHIHVTNLLVRDGHHHHGDGHHHHHHDADDEAQPRNADSEPAVPSPDHDDDAIYLTLSIPPVGRVGSAHDEGYLLQGALALVSLFHTPCASLLAYSPLQPHPPPSHSPGPCPIYLLTLSLLI